MREERPRTGLFAVVGPGLLVAATGVGAGDLATASFAGNRLGVAILWAVVLGAALKYLLNEGLARWQLATGDTLLEGCMAHLGRPFHACFLLYLIPWSFFVGSALMSACGATAHAMLPFIEDPSRGKIVFGIAHSLVGLLLVRVGGYGLFEKVMRVCIGVMFVTVVVTAVLIKPDWAAVGSGLVVPRIPEFAGDGLSWTVALMGGVGGTLTVLCYGYWIREEGREGPGALRTCRVDLAAGYGMTALFGIAMVIIGSQLPAVEGTGSTLIVNLADRLEQPLGAVGRWVFLLGAWGAVFSSLLGVWQSVPYLFADFVSMAVGDSREQRACRVAATSRTYQVYLLALAVIPMAGLWFGFKQVQKVYAVYGALFIPFLAVVLLYLNGREKWIGAESRNKPLTSALLAATLALFALAALFEIKNKLGR
jgi:Mn2+/Fe2+ NRAMP family transporter